MEGSRARSNCTHLEGHDDQLAPLALVSRRAGCVAFEALHLGRGRRGS